MDQKILLVLSAIIVGLAILAGIRASQENLLQANQDAIRQELLDLASRAQAWYRTPQEMGGGGGSFVGLTLAVINFDSERNVGTFELSNVEADYFEVTAIGKEGSPLHATISASSDSISIIQVTP